MAFKNIEKRKPLLDKKKYKKAAPAREELLSSVVEDQEVEDKRNAEDDFNSVFLDVVQNLGSKILRKMSKPGELRLISYKNLESQVVA